MRRLNGSVGPLEKRPGLFPSTSWVLRFYRDAHFQLNVGLWRKLGLFFGRKAKVVSEAGTVSGRKLV